MSLEDDWIEVDDTPARVDNENGFIVDESWGASSLSFEHQTQFLDQLQKNRCDCPQIQEEVNKNANSLCIEEKLPPSVGFQQFSVEARTEIILRPASSIEDRDEKIAQYERRIQAMEHGIRSLHTQMHANPGIRQALKVSMLGNVDTDEDNHSSISMPSNWEELPEEIGYELADVLECTKTLGISLTKRGQELPKLSFLSFQDGDIALFMPAFLDNRRIWMAFNSGCPHYYLSQVL
jgi:hypothetical protein